MANLLEQALNKQPVANQQLSPVFTFDSDGKVRPMAPKGKLLPSRIFGSPITYAKDIKQDIVNIGKASKGKANDHELGRINDIGVKLGSLAIAAYLCVKNPLKLNKTMQFVGFGSFFASMALLPKLLIQAPLKARTGVDIHQKYIDSQGRKKMLFQDPQYDLTDLYSQEDLDRIGKKLNVSENLPDRNSFIKQRAKKVGVQGNTLWMLSAGAAPIFSALMCSAIEKPINNGLMRAEMSSSERALKNRVNLKSTIPNGKDINHKNIIEKGKEKLFNKSFEKFINNNLEEPLDEKMIKKISNMFPNVNSASVQDAIEAEIKENMIIKETLNLDMVKKALKGIVSEDVFANLTEEQAKNLDKAISAKSYKGISEILTSVAGGNKRQQVKLSSEITNVLQNTKKTADIPKVKEVKNSLYNLLNSMSELTHNKKLLDNFIASRVGDKSGTYIANTWDKVTNTFIKGLKLTDKELRAVSQGNMSVIDNKLNSLVKDGSYEKLVNSLFNIINEFEANTGEEFISTIDKYSENIFRDARRGFKSQGMHKIADKIIAAKDAPVKENIGTLKNTVMLNAKERALGASSSFYRIMQTIDVYKRAQDGTLLKQIEKKLVEQTKDAGSDISVEEAKKISAKLVDYCKKVMVNATTVDYVEKLKTKGFELSETEYKTVLGVLFDADAGDTISDIVKESKLLEGFKNYKKTCMEKIANWQNSITPELQRRVVTGITNSANAAERNNLAGKPAKLIIQDAAKQMYNSKKWLKLWGALGAVIAGTVLLTGLFLGRKGKTEKEVEAKSKVNE